MVKFVRCTGHLTRPEVIEHWLEGKENLFIDTLRFGTMKRNDPEDDFKDELLKAVDICINRYAYRPSYFLQMLGNYGAVGTAIKLATASKFHEGFTKLWELGRLDLTVEAIMIRNPYRQLFSKEVIDKALGRLKALGYKY